MLFFILINTFRFAHSPQKNESPIYHVKLFQRTISSELNFINE